MEIAVDQSTDNINLLCRTCMNYLQEEATAQNYLFIENAATDVASRFTNITSLQVYIYIKLLPTLFYLIFALFS